MYSLAALFVGHLNDKTGPAVLSLHFINHRDAFRQVAIDPMLCSLEGKGASDNFGEEAISSYQSCSRYACLKRKFKGWMRDRLLGTYLGSCFILYYSLILKSNKLLHLHKKELQSADILLTNDLFTAYYIAKHYPSKNHIFVMHNNGEILKMLYISMPHLKQGFMNQWLEKIAAYSLEQAHRIAFVSKTACKTFKKQHPEYVDKLVYIANGMEDIANPSITYDAPLKLIVIGSVKDRKNQIAVIKAVESLHDMDISLFVVGDGPQFDEYQKYVLVHKVKNIVFVGAIEHFKVTDYLSKANCFISASRDEGLPLAGVEAIRAGLPLIMTDVGGCRELIDNNGYLIPSNNQTALVEAIRKMATLPTEERKRMGMRSREIYERDFGLDTLLLSYKNLVDGLCEDGLLNERRN